MNQAFLKRINTNDINKGLAPKEKVVKKAERVYLTLSKKRKRKIEKSNIAKTIADLVKSKAKSGEEIQNYFVRNFKVVKNEDISFYKTIIETKIMNGNVKISDTLANKPLYSYISATGIDTRSISNDALSCQLLFHNILLKHFAGITEMYEDTGYVDRITFCSLPFMCDGNVEKGYYQDFSGSFAAVGMQIADETTKTNIFNELAERVVFRYKGNDYVSYGNENSCVIAITSWNKEKLKAAFDGMKTFSATNKIVINEKVSTISNKIRYVNCEVKTDDFCPAFMITPQKVGYSILFRYKYDYNKLLDGIKRNYQQNKKMVFPPNLFYWDTVVQFFDFIGIIAVTCDFLDGKTRQDLAVLYDKYLAIKDIVELWKQIQLSFQHILKDFYDSFNNIINYDKLMGLRSRLTRYIEDREVLKNDSSYTDFLELIRLLNEIGVCGCIANQFNDKIENIADEMLRILNNLNRYAVNTLVVDLRRLGFAIYNMSFVPNKNKDNVAFPIIFSPGGFLGNVAAYQNLDTDPLVIILEEMRKRKDKSDNAQISNVQKVTSLFDNMQNYKISVLTRAIGNYLTQKGKVLNEDDLNALIDQILQDLTEVRQKELVNIITTSILGGLDIDSVNLSLGNEITNMIDNYILSVENDMLQAKNASNQAQYNINNMIINKNQQERDLYNKRQTNDYLMDEDDDKASMLNKEIDTTSNLSGTTQRTQQQRKNIFDEIMNKKPNKYYQKYPRLPSQWYADVILLSGLYNDSNTKQGYKALAGIPPNDLFANYPIDQEIIEVILADYNLPDLDKVLNSGIYNPTNMKRGNIDYTDKNYIKKRIKQIEQSKIGPFIAYQ